MLLQLITLCITGLISGIRLKWCQTQVHVYLQSSVGSRMTSFDRDISSCGTLTSWACRSQKGHLDVTKYPLWDEWGICRRRELPLSFPLPLCLPLPEPSSVHPAETGRARRPETVDSGFDEACYQLPAARTGAVPTGTKFGSISFCPGREKTKQGSTSAAVL